MLVYPFPMSTSIRIIEVPVCRLDISTLAEFPNFEPGARSVDWVTVFIDNLYTRFNRAMNLQALEPGITVYLSTSSKIRSIPRQSVRRGSTRIYTHVTKKSLRDPF